MCLCSLGSLLGCGDGIVGADYFGEALFRFSGEINIENDQTLGMENTPASAGIFWANQTAGGYPVQVRTDFPTIYEIELFTPPPDELLLTTPTGARIGIGYPIVYHDMNADNDWSDEVVLGGAESRLVLYQPDDGTETGFSIIQFEPGCAFDGEPTMSPMAAEGVSLLIAQSSPEALPDLDCDGDLEEWAALCTWGCGAVLQD